jgi:hypothetical protein
MTMKIELTPEVQAGLLSQAQENGLSLEAFAELVLQEKSRETNRTSRERSAPPQSGEPFWKSFTSQVHALPDSVFRGLPEDGASEHDHYLYGAPKRNA